jgi:hypothetical protein
MFAAALVFGITLLPGRGVERIDVSAGSVCARFVVACTVALFVLRLVRPFAWLRLFSTDYQIGFLFIAGLVFVLAGIREASANARLSSFLIAILSAAFMIAIPGLLIASKLAHVSVSGDRWWRLPFMVLAGLPLFYGDEVLVRRLRWGWKSAGVGLITRLLLFLLIVTGVLTLNSENAFLLMILPILLIFWIGLWFATGVVHRHTESPIAAALFAALVQGWVFAAFFVTI